MWRWAFQLFLLQHALRSYSLVFDAVYTPKITRLRREADESGAVIVSGLEMFIGQAYDQYEKFTGLSGKILWIKSIIVYQHHGLHLNSSSLTFLFLFFLAAPKDHFRKIMESHSWSLSNNNNFLLVSKLRFLLGVWYYGYVCNTYLEQNVYLKQRVITVQLFWNANVNACLFDWLHLIWNVM